MQVAIELHVGLCGALPAKVLAHGLVHELVPLVAVIPEQACGTEDGVVHLVSVEVREREAGALAGELVIGDDGVLEAAGLAHHGQGAVAHGDDLREAAGLELGRHEEHVGAGVHALRERGVELDARAHLTGVLILEPAQTLLVVGVTGAEHGHLHAALQNPLEGVHHKIHALLAREARDHHHERAVIANLEPQFFLELGLAQGLAGHVVGAEVRSDARVGRGVELLDVDAVQDALQHVVAVAQDPVEALAVLGRLDLAGIAGRDGRDRIGVVQAAEHVVDGIGIAAELAGSGRDVPEPQHVVEQHVGELALERHVVDREHGAHVFIEGETLVVLAQKDRGERGLPVVAVEHVALKALGQVLQRLGHGLGEESEALAVIEEAVRVAARKVVLVVEEQVGDAVVHELFEPAVLVAPAKGHVEVAYVLHLLLVLVRDAGVLGHHHDALGSGVVERRRKRPRHVAQAAGLDERRALGRCEDDLQFLL